MPRHIAVPGLDPNRPKPQSREELDREKGAQAALYVATYATDADDCRMLLDMLGLLDDDAPKFRTGPASSDHRSPKVDRR